MQTKLLKSNRRKNMKKLYSKFVESRVKQYLLSHGEEHPRLSDRHLSLVRPGTVQWQPILAKLPATATRWVE